MVCTAHMFKKRRHGVHRKMTTFTSYSNLLDEFMIRDINLSLLKSFCCEK